MSMPAAARRDSPAKCGIEPLPEEAKFNPPGFFFPYSTSSASVRIGSLGFTASSSGMTATSVTGARSRSTLKGILGVRGGAIAIAPALVRARVSPFGAALAAASVPMTPPAPERLSIKTGRPRMGENFCPSTRASRSFGPPGGKGTMMRSGPSGRCAGWARAGRARGRAAAAAIRPARRRRVVTGMLFLPAGW